MNNEVTNYLLAYKNMKIIQRKDMFNFSLDTVLLANFATINKNVDQILDFGTNNAAIPLLLSRRTSTRIVGIEIQKEAVDLAIRNVELNHLEHQIKIIHGDIKDYAKTTNERYKLILCNPPFFKLNEQSHLNDSIYQQIARHELAINLEEIIQCASVLLDNKGRFAMVHRPERMVEILEIMKKYDIEPKIIQFVYPKTNKEAKVFLIEGMYKGNTGLKIRPPLYVHNEDGSYTNDVLRMFGEDV